MSDDQHAKAEERQCELGKVLDRLFPFIVTGRVSDVMEIVRDVAAQACRQEQLGVRDWIKAYAKNSGITISIPEDDPNEAWISALLTIAIAQARRETEERHREMTRLIKIGHCPWDVEIEEGEDLPEPHCHADNDGECNFPYCPQPVAAQVRREAFGEVDRLIEFSISHYDESEGGQRITLQILRKRVRALPGEAEKAAI